MFFSVLVDGQTLSPELEASLYLASIHPESSDISDNIINQLCRFEGSSFNGNGPLSAVRKTRLCICERYGGICTFRNIELLAKQEEEQTVCL